MVVSTFNSNTEEVKGGQSRAIQRNPVLKNKTPPTTDNKTKQNKNLSEFSRFITVTRS